MDVAEPNWVDITTIGSAYDEQMDVNAHPNASTKAKYRHRIRSFTGETYCDWSAGPAPRH